MPTYSPESLGIKAPAGGFQQGGWYNGRQYWGGTLSDPGVIHEQSNQQGAGQAVSAEVNLQSDVAQGNQLGDIERYLEAQRQKQTQIPSLTPVGKTAGSAMGTSSMSTGAVTGAGGIGVTAPTTTIDLQGQYNELMQSPEIQAKKEQLSQYDKEYAEAKAKINDNPFLSEATRVGRVAKLDELYRDRTNAIRGEVAQAQADAETQINLALKQFDINSEQVKQAQDQLNFLLQSGALANASGEDIANLTRATGISSNLILGAIQASQQANVKPEIITSTDNAGNVTITAIDALTGQIISQQSAGAIGGAKTTGGTSTIKPGSSEYLSQGKGEVSQYLYSATNDYGHVSPTDWNKALQAWMSNSLGTRNEFIENFKNLTDPNRGDFSEQSGYGFSKYLREE